LEHPSVDVQVLDRGSNSESELRALLHQPVKDCNDFFELADLNGGAESDYDGRTLNLLVSIKRIGKMAEITTKYNTLVKKRELRVFDHSCPNFIVTLWGDEHCFLADCWTPQETILFLADVRLTHSKYQNQLVAATTAKSVVTPNPNTPQGRALHEFARKMRGRTGAFDFAADEDKENEALAQTPAECVNVSEAKCLAALAKTSPDGAKFCTVFGYLTQCDLDAPTNRVVSKVCSVCRRRMDSASASCVNFDCVQSTLVGERATSGAAHFERYTLTATISDATGSLEMCSFASAALENLLTYSPEKFAALDETQRCVLKSELTFELAKFLLKVEPVMSARGFAIRILRAELASQKDFLDSCGSACGT